MEEIEKKVYSIPVSAFIGDIKRCGIKGSTNRMTNIMRHRAFNMLSALWVIQKTGLYFNNNDGWVWISKTLSREIGSNFDSNFVKLCKVNKNRYERKVGFDSFSTSYGYKFYETLHYKINSCAGKCGMKLKCEDIDESHELYKDINHILEKVENYIKKSQLEAKTKLRPSEAEFVEKYYDLCINEERAISVLESKYGMSLAEVLHYKNLKVDRKGKKTLLKIHKVDLFYTQYIEMKRFNSNYYRVTSKYCRIYTELHRMITEARNCLCSSTGEKMVELYDMHGAHTTGYFTMCACLAEERGYKTLASKFRDYVYAIDADPYRFAKKGLFEKDRETAKKATMFFIFADLSVCNCRSFYIGNMKKMNNYSEMLFLCKQVLTICEDYGSVLDSLDEPTLNDIFSEVKVTPEFWYVLVQKKFTKISLRNYGTYTTLNSIASLKDMDKGFADFNSFRNAVDAAYKAMLHYHAEQCLIEEFGKEAFYIYQLLINIFYEKANKIIKPIHEELKRKYPNEKIMSIKELSKGNVPNVSVVNQVAEGWTMIDNIVPELCDKTGCQDIVTIHDAILVPESIAHKINVKELNMKVVSMFIMNVEYAFKHIDAYFNGETEAPFSYVA